MKRISFGVGTLCVLLSALPAHAQVASLGKGWLLDSAGSITSAPGEVISGRNSIKGSSSNSDPSVAQWFLVSDPGYIKVAPNQTYTVTLSYRIITAAPGGFGVAFNSSVGRHGASTVIRGPNGSSGTATLAAALQNYPDYYVNFNIVGSGAIVIDDIRITDSTGQVVASENAEGPALAPGPLNFQLTDAIALLTDGGASVNSAARKDLDGDGYPETILTVTNAGGAADLFKPIVIESSARMRLATADVFPGGAPTLMNSPVTLFPDIDHDGRPDILFAEAGLDHPPWTGARIGVALNVGGGRYRDVSSLVPTDQWADRAYAIEAGDIDGDGRVEIVLPSSNDPAATALLHWNGNGFDEQRNWIPASLWKNRLLYIDNWMVLSDLDQDGKLDLVVAGEQNTPNLQIVFGGVGGFANATPDSLLVLPDGPFGHTPCCPNVAAAQGAEVDPVVVADFNNDGLPDILATERRKTTYQPGVYADANDPNYADIHANGGTVNADVTFQMFVNQGSRKFVDIGAASSAQNFDTRTYRALLPIDLNNDGFLDMVGVYARDSYAGVHFFWGTTLFLNDGTGAFQVVDGKDFLPVTTTPSNGQRWNLGSFVPTLVSPQRTEGIVFESVGGCGTGSKCTPTGLNLYKVVANGAIGTGPNFVDPASLGVPGFNEFYYLRHYPDVAAAVQAGQYRSGLEHYAAVGAAKGYRPHAPTGALVAGASIWSDNRAYRLTYGNDGNVVLYDDRTQTPLWATHTDGTTPGTFRMQSDGDLVVTDAQGVVRWESKTSGNPGAYFVLQNDGNLAIFKSDGNPIWDRSQSP